MQSLAAEPRRGLLLHIGCGPKRKKHTLPAFASQYWREVRFDIDEGVSPDIIGTMTDMSAVETGSIDALFSSHNVEHLYPHEVPVAFAEFHRALKADGFAIITCPDLQSVAALIAEDKLLDTAYVSPAGPITPLDILFGHRGSMQRGNLYMAHHVGFTQKVLAGTLKSAGFGAVLTVRRPEKFDLWAVAMKRGVKRPITYKTLRPGNFVIAAMPHSSLEVEVRAINYNQHGTDRAGLVDVVKTPAARSAPCHFPFAHFHVGFSGNVTPCCHIRSDAAEHAQFLYGNLSAFGSIYEAWASQVGAAWRRELISPLPKRSPCNTCSVGFLDGKEGSRAQAELLWKRLIAAGVLQSPETDADSHRGNTGATL